jgi:xanthosine phosphorylase
MTIKNKTSAHLAAEKIQQAAPHFKPKIGVVLGSGLGSFASQLQDTIILPYEQLPGFPKVTVHGHGGNLILGYLNGIAVACLEGRAHSYEGCNHEIVKTYIRALRLIGCCY